MTVFARQLLASNAALQRTADILTELLAARHGVALRVCDLGRGAAAGRRLDAVCVELARRLRDVGTSGLELTVSAAAIRPVAAWEIRCGTLGSGVLNVVLDERAAADDALWRELWQLRMLPVFVAAWPTVSTVCPLLTAERAADVLPGIGLQAPSQAAFVHLPLDLAAHCSRRGVVDTRTAESRLAMLLADADTLHDTTCWPTPAMQHDAWWNRRVAIEIRGIGEIVKRAGCDPRSPATLAALDALLSRLRRYAAQLSRELARSRETLAAIDGSDPCTTFANEAMRDAWRQRWHNAVRRDAVAHRNLIALSPWSLFPQDGPHRAYVSLLPLLAHADACAFRHDAAMRRWRAPRMKAFFERMAAVRRAGDAEMVVAEPP